MEDDDVGGDEGDGTSYRGLTACSTDARGIQPEKGHCVEDGGIGGRKDETLGVWRTTGYVW
jgi:hypothetical protein